MAEQDQRISEAVERDQARLRNFIRSRVADPGDAEDILQEVFYELVEAYRVMKPIEQVTAWLYRVAHNRITDLFRKRRFETLRSEPAVLSEDGEPLLVTDLLPSPKAVRKPLTREAYSSMSSMMPWESFPTSNGQYSSRTKLKATALKRLRHGLASA